MFNCGFLFDEFAADYIGHLTLETIAHYLCNVLYLPFRIPVNIDLSSVLIVHCVNSGIAKVWFQNVRVKFFFLFHCCHSSHTSFFFTSGKISPSYHIFLICNTLRSTSCTQSMQKDRGEPLVSAHERKSFWYVVSQRAASIVLSVLEKPF